MPENKLGEIRRSHCVSTFGPGAIVEFRIGEGNGAAVSAIVGGLEYWDKFARPPGLSNDQITHEERLEELLKVTGFRLPPVDPDAKKKDPKLYHPYLAAVRFPYYLQCPNCLRLRPANKWDIRGPGNPALFCSKCSKPQNDVYFYVIPARFVVTCTKGHLQEFPWDVWVGHKKGCKAPDLVLKQGAKAGLAGLILSCQTCNAERSMEGAFGRDVLEKLKVTCAGERPWLGPGAAEPCTSDSPPRAVQRGASNLYFPVVASALAVPPFTETIQIRLRDYWEKFMAKPREKWPSIIEALDLDKDLGMSPEDIISAIDRSLQARQETNYTRIRFDEYEKISAGAVLGEQTDFDIRNEQVPQDLAAFFDRIVRVVRLREVRAIRGFTRLVPPSGEFEENPPALCRPYKDRPPWLPAIEVRGEGIFLRLKETALKQWMSNPKATTTLSERAARVHAAYVKAWQERYKNDTLPTRTITPRFLLVHSLAHALIRQLTISSGYSSASLRERLYIDDKLEMAALLIYTATPDSDGSLGGLERQGKPQRVRSLVKSALSAMRWCSNDPLCITDISTFSDAQNLAACHSCMLIPETSCEEFNVLLDRATLVGFPGLPEVGFFSPLFNPIAQI